MIEEFDNAILNTFPDPKVNGLNMRRDDGSQLTIPGIRETSQDASNRALHDKCAHS